MELFADLWQQLVTFYHWVTTPRPSTAGWFAFAVMGLVIIPHAFKHETRFKVLLISMLAIIAVSLFGIFAVLARWADLMTEGVR